MDFTIDACSGRTGWDVEPEEEREVDLSLLPDRFDEVLVDTPHVVILKIDSGEVSVYPDASMFVKKVETREEAEDLVERVAESLDAE